jgi:hypothetical protein
MDSKAQLEQPMDVDLAALTLQQALDVDFRPSFVFKLASNAAYDEPLDLVYSNPALDAAAGLLAKITGRDEASILNESTEAQLAFRDWLCGGTHEGSLPWRGHVYTFEGHLWTALGIGQYRVVSGVPMLLMWTNTAPAGSTHRKTSRQGRALQSKPSRDITPTTPPTLPLRLPATPENGDGADSSAACTHAAQGPFDYTSAALPPDLVPALHIDYFHSVDWANTSLGPIESWSPDLRCMTNMVLGNSAPAVLFWGDDAAMIYNEAYIPLLGRFHPCIGKNYRTHVAEHWPTFQTIVHHVNDTGETLSETDILVFTDQGGYLEETHWSFQFVPVLLNR